MKKLLAIAASIFVTLSFSSCGLISGLLNSSENNSVDSSNGTAVTTEEAQIALKRIQERYNAFKAIKEDSTVPQWDKGTIKEVATKDDSVFTLSFAYSMSDQYMCSFSTQNNSKLYYQAKDLYEAPEDPDAWINTTIIHDSKSYEYHYINAQNEYIHAYDNYHDASLLNLQTNEMERETSHSMIYNSKAVSEDENFWAREDVTDSAYTLWTNYLIQFEAAVLQLEGFIPNGLINLDNGVSMIVTSNGENHLYCQYDMPLVGSSVFFEFEDGILTHYKSIMSGSLLTDNMTIGPKYDMLTTEYFFYPEVCEVSYPDLTKFEKND